MQCTLFAANLEADIAKASAMNSLEYDHCVPVRSDVHFVVVGAALGAVVPARVVVARPDSVQCRVAMVVAFEASSTASECCLPCSLAFVTAPASAQEAAQSMGEIVWTHAAPAAATEIETVRLVAFDCIGPGDGREVEVVASVLTASVDEVVASETASGLASFFREKMGRPTQQMH